MNKLKKGDEIPLLLINETLDTFFARGKKIASLLDQKKNYLPDERLVLKMCMTWLNS